MHDNTPQEAAQQEAPSFLKREPYAPAVPGWRTQELAQHPTDTLNLLLIGDIVGKPGRDTLAKLLPELRRELHADLVIANTENLAHGFGVTPDTIAEVMSAGVDVCTGGNHTWKNAAGVQWMTQSEPPHLLRPANILAERPGADHVVLQMPGLDRPLIVSCLLGEVFMKDPVYAPAATIDALIDLYADDNAIHIIDFHAEATGEKRILGWYLDGRAAAIVGTHTHIQTADEQILPDGTAYMSDLGFSGATDSSLGMRRDLVMKKVIYKEDVSLEPPENADEGVIHGLVVNINRTTGITEKLERIKRVIHL